MIPNKNLSLHQAMNNSRNDKNKQTTKKNPTKTLSELSKYTVISTARD